ncbi:MAG: hypothetical protein AAGF75_03565 [Cyanobacteria bacterium P01_H01_bin.130]
MSPARTSCLGVLARGAIGTLLLMLPFSSSDGAYRNEGEKSQANRTGGAHRGE